MKSEFQAKFLQNLLKKRENEGFTLIELLVVIIIIGILSAIALPSFLNQANKARESEGKQYAGSMNRAQQAAFLEGQAFSSDFGGLGLGIATQTTNYVYRIAQGDPTTAITVAPTDYVINVADPITSVNLRTFIGMVDILTSGGAATSLATLCQSNNAGDPPTAIATAVSFNAATNVADAPSCVGPNWKDVSAPK